MAEFIGPVVGWLASVLTDMQEPAWAEVKKSWTGVAINWPVAAVMPRNTDFDPEGTATHGTHGLTVKFGVSGDDPDHVTVDAIATMTAIDAAIGGAVGTWLPQMTRVFVARHDYGPLFEKGGSWAYFPELHLEVETQEI